MDSFPKSGHISMAGRIGGSGGTCPHKIYELLRNLVFNNRNVNFGSEILAMHTAHWTNGSMNFTNI